MIWICLAVAILIFAGLGQAPLEPFDDACYADVAKNIVRNANWLDFYWLGGQPFLEKPPLYFWWTALSFRVFGIGEFGARLLPALAGIGTIALVFLFSRRHDSTGTAILSVLLLTANSQFWEFSSRAMLDMPVTFFITLSLFFFSLSLEQPRMRWYLLYGGSFALAILCKSVVGLFPVLISGVFLLLTEPKRLFSSQYWAGTGLGLGLASVWHIFAFLRHGEIFVREYLGYHVIQRIAGDIGYHREPFLYFLNHLYESEPFFLFFFATALPLLIFQIIRSRGRIQILLLVWTAVVFFGISFSRSKLPWYVIPLFPPMALAIASSFRRLAGDWKPFSWAFRAAVALALFWSMHTVYQFRIDRRDHGLNAYMPDQIRTLLFQVKRNSTPDDIVFIYGVGSAVHLTNFYAERRICYLFDDDGTLSVHRKIPSDYIGKGVLRRISGTDELPSILAERRGVLLVERKLYSQIQARIRCRTVAESTDLVVVRSI